MKDRIFGFILAVITVIGIGVTAALIVYGYNLWKDISIVEMIANWGY